MYTTFFLLVLAIIRFSLINGAGLYATSMTRGSITCQILLDKNTNVLTIIKTDTSESTGYTENHRYNLGGSVDFKVYPGELVGKVCGDALNREGLKELGLDLALLFNYPKK